MTELETMQRAKMYIDKMANGIDPVSDKRVPDSDCINQVRVSRCLFYVSDVLRKLIENGGSAERSYKVKKTAFSITPEELKKYVFDTNPVTVSEITKRINALVDPEAMTKLKYSSITSFLMQSGLIVEERYANGNKAKVPTADGKSIGISREERNGMNGAYFVTVYNTEAQKFILDNICAIIEINNTPRADAQSAELQGQPWTDNYDEALVDLFNKQVPVSEIAVTLKRTEIAVRARLKKLGLINNRSDVN
ncbi:MAG: hypothetical protein J5879_08855 [Clostridia bacterium]|nr:hypothetical protein [Clostridia bacterium]